LTIVQDFPKKKSEPGGLVSSHNVEMVQGKAHDIKIIPEEKGTTLTIVQDFPKKKSDGELNRTHNIEMVQGKGKAHDFTIQPDGNLKFDRKTTLEIV
jgi:hypothetical protein